MKLSIVTDNISATLTKVPPHLGYVVILEGVEITNLAAFEALDLVEKFIKQASTKEITIKKEGNDKPQG